MENLYLIKIISSMVFSFVLMMFAFPKLISYLRKKNLVDVPNQRASHVSVTPTSGGILFVIPLVLSTLFFGQIFAHVIISIVLVGILVLGWIDDRIDLRASVKLIIEAVIAVLLYDISINTLVIEEIVFSTHLPIVLSVLFTFLVIAGIMNAVNLIDGIDGLAGGVSLINSLVFAAIFLHHENYFLLGLHLTFAISLIAFLKFNFNPAKIFMGDTGSLFIGLLTAISLLVTLQYKNVLTMNLAFATIIFPSIDMLRLFIERIIKKKSPFKADRNHYHHHLLKLGDTAKKASIMCYVLHANILLSAGILATFIFSIQQVALITLVLGILMYVVLEIRHFMVGLKIKRELDQSLKSNLFENRFLNRIK